MAGLPWFELSVDFHDDPKVLALASRLREPLADSYVSRLYAYCYKHAQDRFDASVASDTIEKAVAWRGRRGVLFDSLFAAGVLERDASMVVVHGVKDRLEPHLAKRAVDRQRQAAWRSKAAKQISNGSNGVAPVTEDVTRDNHRESPVSHGGTLTLTQTLTQTLDPTIVDPCPPAPVAAPVRASRERTKLGPLGSRLRAECERGLGYGLTPCSQSRADELERRITAAGGVEPAFEFVAATIRKRAGDPKSVGLLVDILEPFAGGEVRQ